MQLSRQINLGTLLLLLFVSASMSNAKCPHLIALSSGQRSLLQASAPAPLHAAVPQAPVPAPAVASAAKNNCRGSRTHPYVGYHGNLTTMDHGVSGHISILDDCTFRVTKFSYDGLAPAAHWWGGNGLAQDQLRKGKELDPMRLVDPIQDGAMDVQLPGNITWNDISIISVWCEEFLADFGHVILGPGNASSLAPAGAPSPSMSAEVAFDHCIDFSPDFYQMQWKLDNADPSLAQNVTIQYRAFLDANMWMGFGYSMDSASQVQMIGSDAVIAGMVGDKCFAYSYFLTAKEQCNYEGPQNAGVCPVSGLLGMPRTSTGNTAQLVTCARSPGNLVTVTYTRPLKASNRYQHDWPVGAPKYAVWAIGPLSQGSTAEQPVVLFHAPSDRGQAYASADFKLSLGMQSQCKQLLMPGGNVPAPAAAPTKQPPQLLDLTKSNMIEITTGTNKNYPNPPAWGLSLHVNGLETPVVRIMRGTNYTFVIKAGETHPIYVTDSINGGGEDTDILYGGTDTNTGTVDNPFTFYWTPNMSTPDTVFYQCYAHRKLGWIMQVVNPDGSLAGVANPNKGTVQALASLPQALTNPTVLASASGGSAAAPAPAPGGNACRAKFGNGVDELYAHCLGLDSNVRLNWRLDTLAGRRDMTGLLQCSSGIGWCAWGLPQTPGHMIGSSAIVVRTCATCPSGASVEQYYLAAKAESGVQPAPQGSLQLMKAEALKQPDGTLQAQFTLQLPEHVAASNYIVDCIGASGQLSSSGGLAQHDTSASLSAVLNLAAGTSAITTTSLSRFIVVHGALMVVAWCFVLPISVMIARTCKPDWPPAWFHSHRALGVLAVCMIVAGMGLGIKAWRDGVTDTALFDTHLAIGFITVTLAMLQATAVLFRPKHGSALRWVWELAHHWNGRMALLLAFANAIIGFNLQDLHNAAWWSWGLAVIWAAIFLAGAGKEVYNNVAARRKAQGSGLAFEEMRGSAFQRSSGKVSNGAP